MAGKAKKVLIIGAYGCGNKGDDAILKAIVSRFSSFEITATSGRADNIGKWLGINTTPLRLNEGINKSVFLSMFPNCIRILFHLIRSNALFFGGGGLMHDMTPYNLPFMFMWHSLAKLFGKNVYYISIGVGPIKTNAGKKLCARRLKRADGLFPRDEHGLNLLKSMGIETARLSCDAVFVQERESGVMPLKFKGIELPAKGYLTVTASQWFEAVNFWERDRLDFSTKKEILINGIKNAIRIYGMPAVFVPTVVHDFLLAKEIEPLFEKGTYYVMPYEGSSLFSMVSAIENSHFLLGMRMHSMIFAARAAVPFVALVYDTKVQSLLEWLNITHLGVTLGDATNEKVARLIETSKQEHGAISNGLNERVSFMSKIVVQQMNDVADEITSIK